MPKIKQIKLNGVEVPLEVLADNIQEKILRENLVEYGMGRYILEVTYEPTLDLTKPLFATEKPKKGQEYWVTVEGSVIESKWEDDITDRSRFLNNNVFLTQEAAEKALEIKKAVDEFKRICRENGLDYYKSLYRLSKEAYGEPDEVLPFRVMSDRIDLVLMQHLI